MIATPCGDRLSTLDEKGFRARPPELRLRVNFHNDHTGCQGRPAPARVPADSFEPRKEGVICPIVSIDVNMIYTINSKPIMTLLADPIEGLWRDDSRSGLVGAAFILPCSGILSISEPRTGRRRKAWGASPRTGAVRHPSGVPGACAPGSTPPPLVGLRRTKPLGSERTLGKRRESFGS
jgi:hypothetical protein